MPEKNETSGYHQFKLEKKPESEEKSRCQTLISGLDLRETCIFDSNYPEKNLSLAAGLCEPADYTLTDLDKNSWPGKQTISLVLAAP